MKISCRQRVPLSLMLNFLLILRSLLPSRSMNVALAFARNASSDRSRRISAGQAVNEF